MKNTRDYRESLNEDLKDPAEAAAYLEAAFVEEDEAGFLMALRDVTEAHGISQIALQTGLGRESLYKSLSENGNPKLKTLKSVLEAIGVQMTFVPLGRRCAAG